MKHFRFYFIITIIILSGCKNGTGYDLDPLEITTTVKYVSTDGGNDGAIDLAVAGGKGPYSFTWSNGYDSQDANDLTPGTYSITVTDSKGNSSVITIDIYTNKQEGTVTDVDGNIYKTIVIGDQVWIAENLKVTHDSEGNSINSYLYNNVSALEAIYGRLYTWETVMNGSTDESSQGIAPDGWHIPSDAEWQVLFDYLGGSSVAGGKMKTTGTDYWNPPNSNATNSSGFSSLPAGGGYPQDFEGLGDGTHYWSSTSHGSNIIVPTIHSGNDVLLPEAPKTFSLSVRCIKDYYSSND